jgi:hypothetical protein
MTKRPTLLADVTELRNVLHAMDAWGTASGDLTSTNGRRRFVDDNATDELSGLALTRLARMVFTEKARTAETRMPGDDTSPAAPDPVRVPRQGYRQLTANRASHPDRAQL